MNERKLKTVRKRRRLLSLRSQLRRTADRPRLSVHRTSKHIYAQVIDDEQGRTLASASTSSKQFGAEHGKKTKTERAAMVGALVARLALEAGVKEVVFDRGSARYHGRVKALAESARQSGLVF